MPILGIVASSRLVAVPNSYESIATVTLGSVAASITFSSIPATYQHLQIRISAKWDYAVAPDFTNLVVRANADSGNNYSYHRIWGNGTGIGLGSSGTVDAAYLQTMMPTNTSGETNVFGASIVDILDYADTNKYKTFRALGGFDRNGSGVSALVSASWRNTSAISNITIAPDAGASGWMQYSSFALYGIKG
jgi:hypothetical protein